MTEYGIQGPLVVGDGPELFEIRTEAQYSILVIADPEGPEPLDPPRFLIGELHLRPELRATVLHEDGSEKPMYYIVEAGVDRLNWRQRPRHIEDDLISDDVFQALKDLAPGSVSSRGTIDLGWRDRPLYHVFRFHGFPEADLLDEVDDRDPILLSECDPPIQLEERGSVRRSVVAAKDDAFGAGQQPPVLALASWLARDDKIIYPGQKTPCVTEGFVKRWRETDISKELWADNYERDFFFNRWTYGAEYQGGIPYKWVDLPD